MSSKERRAAIRYQNTQSRTGAKIPSMAEAIAAVAKQKEEAAKPKVR